MLRRVALVRTDDSEQISASFIRVTRVGELGTTPAVTSNRLHRLLVTDGAVTSSPILGTLMKEALSSSESSHSVTSKKTAFFYWHEIYINAVKYQSVIPGYIAFPYPSPFIGTPPFPQSKQ
jgi:hypothetical protein